MRQRVVTAVTGGTLFRSGYGAYASRSSSIHEESHTFHSVRFACRSSLLSGEPMGGAYRDELVHGQHPVAVRVDYVEHLIEAIGVHQRNGRGHGPWARVS